MEQKTIHNVLSLYDSSEFVQKLIANFKNNPQQKLNIKGFLGSGLSLLTAQLYQRLPRPIFLLLDDKEEAAYYLNDLESLFSKEEVLFFPSSYRRPYEIEEIQNANVVIRTEVLNALANKKPKIIVTYSDALLEKVVTKTALSANTLKVKVGSELGIEFISEMLFEYNFNKVDFVSEPGEFSIRGGIIDVFSYSGEHPYRISLFGDEVETIRTFDIDSQLSIATTKEITIIPNLENKAIDEKRESFLEYIPKDSLFITKNIDVVSNQIKKNFEKAEEIYVNLKSEIKRAEPKDLFLDQNGFLHQLVNFGVIELSNKSYFETVETLDSPFKPQPSFNKQFELLIDDLNERKENGFRNALLCSNETQIKRFEEIFDDIGKDVSYIPVLGSLYQGFVDEELKITCFTDHQIFERYYKYNVRSSFSKKESITLKEINTLQVGDFVTHIDYGVGKFAGLVTVDNNGTRQESIKLIYQNNDILYVNIHSLHKIAKFRGKDGAEPKISKLGSPAWKNLKNKTKAKVKEIAFDLIKLYAKRRTRKGFAFSPDTYLQTELEASFIYEDTPDQFKATQDVKADMESDRPMDRLVCGDVGFGKTEVAIRAALKAAVDGKQVAVLVPTTILAFQHYKTFSERLKDLPVKVAYLNRFVTGKKKKDTLEGLKSGQVDIVIGTHQLVNSKLEYKDLGLLIVDEEHKFGVAVKDKLKTLRENIDTLTLTATPIPRTLQFSLMAARDLSVIKTPPPNRQPVETQLVGFNEEVFRDAIMYEMQRGGQVYIIHNRVQSLKDIAGMVQRLVPDARVATGHGQMDGKELEAVLLDFIDGRYDVFVSTTIIESGLDVPNANTILINDAQNFGLADLHQMRGRVGRSNRKAFCYLIAPPISVLTDEARKRLQAIEQFSDLGSGFNIAMKDLEIRGAGNLLGGEQTGFMMDIGFETYQKILNEAIEELKETDFKDLFEEERNGQVVEYVKEVQIDTDLPVQLPDEYIESSEERLILYKELADVEDRQVLEKFRSNLIDRFGELPKEAENLLLSVELKWVSKKLGFEKVVLKKGSMLCYFISKPQSEFYQSDEFRLVLNNVQSNSKNISFKEKPPKNGEEYPTLLLRFENVKNVKQALEYLNNLINS
ncbi:transcription-repair coupling factor [Faecalibacter bovis]|uniref:Transcription-repair-coupling factor n=1 Tax=Faecalibacter bovis TaxID=2898187 RepID=A0ABX7XFQ6_9FLAO|nr:transcription-repair coupling factor [Faecalibacter bovis]QTV06792.1 transcription-repair coupling factor [Faecalibacter bovis]